MILGNYFITSNSFFQADPEHRVQILPPRLFWAYLISVKYKQKYTSFLTLKMEKSDLRTAAKPLGSPIFQDNVLFLHKKHEIAAFVLVDKSGYFDGTSVDNGFD